MTYQKKYLIPEPSNVTNDFKQVPFLRIAALFIIGILLPIYFTACNNLPFATFVLIFALLVIAINAISNLYNLSWLRGILLCFAISITGSMLTINRIQQMRPNGLLLKSNYFNATILNTPQKTKFGFKTEAIISSFYYNNSLNPTNQKTLIYFPENTNIQDLLPGTTIVYKSKCKVINKKTTETGFNYGKYMYFKGIILSNNVKQGHWSVLSRNPQSWQRQLYYFRENLMQRFSSVGLSASNNAVLSALVLGITTNIDAETRKAYSQTGAIHILSVSGLHVGIVFAFFMFLFNWSSNNVWAGIVRTIITIVGVWLFAIISGLSVPVIRAATTYSFLALSQSFNRQVSPMNTLAASAVLILAFDPFQILDIGFQLSYIAVAGILILYPKLYNLCSFNNYLSDKVWSLCMVSVAAQLATFPLSVYYFHIFPNYFIVTNLIVIPLTFIILIAGIVYLFTLKVAIIGVIVKQILFYSIVGINKTVAIIGSWPYSVSEQINLNIQLTFLLYLLIILGSFVHEYRTKTIVWFFLITLLATSVCLLVNAILNM